MDLSAQAALTLLSPQRIKPRLQPVDETPATDEAEVVSDVVAAIYDAAIDPALWPDALARATKFVPGVSSTLFAKDISNKTMTVYHDDGGMDPAYKKLYHEKYAKIDPMTTVQYFAEVGEPYSCIAAAPFDNFYETRIYKEWVKPQGHLDFLCVALEKTATSVAMFGVFLPGVAGEAELRRMRLISPHVRRAVTIGRAIDLNGAKAATFTEAFDGLASCMFMLDAGGRIVHANAAACALAATDNVVRTASGRLTPHDAAAARQLADMLSAAGFGDAALGERGISFPITARDGETYVANLLPLTSGARSRTGSAFSATAMLLVQKATLAAPAAPEVIAKTYKLTPTELRILIAVAEIGGAPEIAEAFGIAETTVKYHLKSLFNKTGTRRQAELVRLLAGFASPLAG